MPGSQGDLYEVLVDTWGSGPVHVKGDLIHSGSTPYDLDWAEKLGVVRKAPEYANSGLESTTQPLNARGEIDEAAQNNARMAAGFEPEDGTTVGTQFEAPGAAEDKPKARAK